MSGLFFVTSFQISGCTPNAAYAAIPAHFAAGIICFQQIVPPQNLKNPYHQPDCLLERRRSMTGSTSSALELLYQKLSTLTSCALPIKLHSGRRVINNDLHVRKDLSCFFGSVQTGCIHNRTDIHSLFDIRESNDCVESHAAAALLVITLP